VCGVSFAAAIITDKTTCFADHDTPLTLHGPAHPCPHQGGSVGVTLRTCPPLVQDPIDLAFTSEVLRRRFMGRTPWEDGP
jgi:hypothetical protein